MQLGEALDIIDEATRRVRSSRDERVLNLSVAPSFATAWLIPHLLDFHEHHPEIEVQGLITADSDFRATDVDLAILFARETGKGCTRKELRVKTWCCSARPMSRHDGTTDDLAAMTFIRILARPGQWRSWLHANGLDHIDVRERSVVLDSTSLGLKLPERDWVLCSLTVSWRRCTWLTVNSWSRSRQRLKPTVDTMWFVRLPICSVPLRAHLSIGYKSRSQPQVPFEVIRKGEWA